MGKLLICLSFAMWLSVNAAQNDGETYKYDARKYKPMVDACAGLQVAEWCQVTNPGVCKTDSKGSFCFQGGGRRRKSGCSRNEGNCDNKAAGDPCYFLSVGYCKETGKCPVFNGSVVCKQSSRAEKELRAEGELRLMLSTYNPELDLEVSLVGAISSVLAGVFGARSINVLAVETTGRRLDKEQRMRSFSVNFATSPMPWRHSNFEALRVAIESGLEKELLGVVQVTVDSLSLTWLGSVAPSPPVPMSPTLLTLLVTAAAFALVSMLAGACMFYRRSRSKQAKYNPGGEAVTRCGLETKAGRDTQSDSSDVTPSSAVVVVAQTKMKEAAADKLADVDTASESTISTCGSVPVDMEKASRSTEE